mmetsp:Transcript_54419/g.129292  ORF Transcript_54419/g.129292 Transcript_54419/m.129292 type:complete len:210 (+) Transcript_54419:1709-2338(+)
MRRSWACSESRSSCRSCTVRRSICTNSTSLRCDTETTRMPVLVPRRVLLVSAPCATSSPASCRDVPACPRTSARMWRSTYTPPASRSSALCIPTTSRRAVSTPSECATSCSVSSCRRFRAAASVTTRGSCWSSSVTGLVSSASRARISDRRRFATSSAVRSSCCSRVTWEVSAVPREPLADARRAWHTSTNSLPSTLEGGRHDPWIVRS